MVGFGGTSGLVVFGNLLFEALEAFADVAGHGDVHFFAILIPVEIKSNILSPFPIF